MKNVSVIGLGKLGASMVAGLASRGINVIGNDVSQQSVDKVNRGEAPVQETGLGEMIAANKSRIRATISHEEAVLASEISFIIVPTPSDRNGAFSLQYARHAFGLLGQALKKKESYHVIVLTSTVLPGSTRYALLPLLEAESGKRCGIDFGLCYNPEFIALGSVIHDFLNPDFYLVGEFDRRSGDALESIHKIVSVNQAPVSRMSLENAELAKIAVNSYVTMKISFANMLAGLCEKIPGGSVDIVSDALGVDKRIGRKYLTGGFGFGGPCFPRDNVALAYMGKKLNVNCDLLEANDTYNRYLSRHYVQKLKPLLIKGETVAILGLAYKPMSHVIEESPGIYLCRELADAGYRVVGYDPLAGTPAQLALQYQALVAHSLEECLQTARVIIVATADERFKSLNLEDFKRSHEKVVVIDFWRCLESKLSNQKGVDYYPIGKCWNDEVAGQSLQTLWQSPT